MKKENSALNGAGNPERGRVSRVPESDLSVAAQKRRKVSDRRPSELLRTISKGRAIRSGRRAQERVGWLE